MPKTPPGQIRKAINDRLVVTFKYAGLPRTCEPHVFGITNGREQLLCWQLSGKSQRGKIPEWRRFDVEDIQEFSLTTETFSGARPVPYPHSRWDQVLESV